MRYPESSYSYAYNVCSDMADNYGLPKMRIFAMPTPEAMLKAMDENFERLVLQVAEQRQALFREWRTKTIAQNPVDEDEWKATESELFDALSPDQSEYMIARIIFAETQNHAALRSERGDEIYDEFLDHMVEMACRKDDNPFEEGYVPPEYYDDNEFQSLLFNKDMDFWTLTKYTSAPAEPYKPDKVRELFPGNAAGQKKIG